MNVLNAVVLGLRGVFKSLAFAVNRKDYKKYYVLVRESRLKMSWVAESFQCVDTSISSFALSRRLLNSLHELLEFIIHLLK